METCRTTAKKAGITLETATELWQYFILKCRENLHVILWWGCTS
jgi:hypothetical protein